MIFSHGERAEAIGVVSFFDKQKLENEVPLDGEILRKTTAEDNEKRKKQKSKMPEYLEKAQKKVDEIGLSMQLVDANIAFDDSEIRFSFLATDRVDFRELVPKLAGLFRSRIHLNQIGARDRAGKISGYGPCGRKFCCDGILTKLPSVSMDMARMQEMAMKGNEKLSGACGKLLCCLAFEADEYREQRKTLPNVGKKVTTPRGAGKAIGLDVLAQKVKVKLDEGGIEVFEASEVKRTHPADGGKSGSSKKSGEKKCDSCATKKPCPRRR